MIGEPTVGQYSSLKLTLMNVVASDLVNPLHLNEIIYFCLERGKFFRE